MEIGANGALNANLGGLTPNAITGANGQNLSDGPSSTSQQQLQGLLNMLSQLAPGLSDAGNTASSSAGADDASNPLEKLINLLRTLLEKMLNPQDQNQSGAQDSSGSGSSSPSSPSPFASDKSDGGRSDSHGGRDSGGGPGDCSPGDTGSPGDCGPGDSGSAGDCGTSGDSGASGCGDGGDGGGGDGGGGCE